MPVINYAYLIKGKNELYVLRSERYVEKWSFQKGS